MKAYLIGKSIDYSYSPRIHKLFNPDIDYEIKNLNEDELESFVENKDFDFINVTIPYKEKVIPLLDYVDEEALEIGSVNTIIKKDDELYGTNTDYYGIKMSFEFNKLEIKDKVVLVLGTGGTSKTVKKVLLDKKAKKIILVSRTKKKAVITYDELDKYYDKIQIIINCTPVGTYPNSLDEIIDISKFTKLEGGLDMIYNPSRTKFIRALQDKNIKNINGLLPLIIQAGVSQEQYTGNLFTKEKYHEVYKKIKDSTRSLSLIGMPGSGKSTYGEKLAKALNYEFFDTDKEIERRLKKSIKEIFETKGEAYFRERELELIREIYHHKNTVISTGGGMVENEEIMSLLKSCTTVIYLENEIENDLYDGSRPLLKNEKDYLTLLNRRESLYKKYQDLSFKNNEENFVERIIEKL